MLLSALLACPLLAHQVNTSYSTLIVGEGAANLMLAFDEGDLLLLFGADLDTNGDGALWADEVLTAAVETQSWLGDRIVIRADGEPLPLRPDRPRVESDADGNLFEFGKAMDRTTLARTIVERMVAEPELHVRIEADRALPYQQVMEIITHLQSIGVRNVGLATREATP